MPPVRRQNAGGHDGTGQRRVPALAKPARAVVITTCALECGIIVPNIIAEIKLAEDGPHVAICRVVLFFARMSLVVVPCLSRLLRHCAPMQWARLRVAVVTVCGAACGSVEPSRGVATALAGWYLISTPVHDAFGGQAMDGPQSDDAETAQQAEAAETLLLACIILMTVNVCLFLCDAMLLTVAPLLRASEPSPPPSPSRAVSHPKVFAYASAEGSEKETCVICLAELEVGEQVARLPCGHTFHSDCVGEWLAGHTSCPLRCAGVVVPSRTMSPANTLQDRWGRMHVGPRLLGGASSASLARDDLSSFSSSSSELGQDEEDLEAAAAGTGSSAAAAATAHASSSSRSGRRRAGGGGAERAAREGGRGGGGGGGGGGRAPVQGVLDEDGDEAVSTGSLATERLEQALESLPLPGMPLEEREEDDYIFLSGSASGPIVETVDVPSRSWSDPGSEVASSPSRNLQALNQWASRDLRSASVTA